MCGIRAAAVELKRLGEGGEGEREGLGGRLADGEDVCDGVLFNRSGLQTTR